jgi:hypothetical protein
VLNTTTAAPVPVASVDPKATLDRVKLDDVGGLLRQESVRKEVGLSDEDFKTLSDLRKSQHTNIQKLQQADIQAQLQGQAGGGGGRGVFTFAFNNNKYVKLRADAATEYAKKVNESLKPDGMKRLKQAVLQAKGPRALLDRLVIRELQLTAEQEDKIDAMLTPAAGEFFTTDKVAKLADDRDAELASAAKVLTADQKKKWDALVGKPLPTADLLKAGPNSEESIKELTESVAFGAAVQVVPAFRPAPPPPPVEEKKEK